MTEWMKTVVVIGGIACKIVGDTYQPLAPYDLLYSPVYNKNLRYLGLTPTGLVRLCDRNTLEELEALHTDQVKAL